MYSGVRDDIFVFSLHLLIRLIYARVYMCVRPHIYMHLSTSLYIPVYVLSFVFYLLVGLPTPIHQALYLLCANTAE